VDPDAMPVFDCDDRKIGKVEYVHFWHDGLEECPWQKPEGFYDLPGELQYRLAREGFVQISRGWFAADAYAMPDQIAELNDEHLRLNVTNDQLITS
jgi:hypothetical protein